MDSSMISKIQKSKRYAEEPERISFSNFDVTFKGDHDTYHVSYRQEDGWRCECHYFQTHGVCSHTMAMERLLGPMVERAWVTPPPQPEATGAKV